MSNPDKHITPWSVSDIQKYLKGELSAREMHQLEKAALDDPFLADAIEGLSQRPAAPLAKDLDDLQTRIGTRVGRKKKPVAWMKMAAAVVLLLGLGYTAWYILIDKRKPALAASAPATIASARSIPSPNTGNADTAKTRITPNAVSANTPPALAKAELSLPPRKTKALRTPHPITNITRVAADTIGDILKNRALSLDITPAPGNLVYSGQVLDRNYRPLANASLLVSGPSNAVTTTNALGQFKLNLRPQDTIQRLTVALAGYTNASLAVNRLNTDDATGNVIFLHEQPAALNEVVTAMDREKKMDYLAAAPSEDRSEKLDSIWLKVAPVTGRQAYLDYLQSGKKSLPVDTTIQGAEVVSFAIDPKGAPSDFKIEHSLSPVHDAGVIRLITDGPRWKVLRGKNIRAMVRVSFP